MQRIAVEQLRPPLLHDLPRVHDDRPVADRRGQVQVVRDEQHGQAVRLPQLVQDRHDLGLRRHVERGRRLVGQQQRRAGQQRGRDHDPLQHATRQFVRVLPQPPFPVGDADLAKHAGRALARLRSGHAQVGPQGLGHEVADPPDRVHVCARILEDHRDLVAVAAQCRSGQRRDVRAVEPDLALDLRALRQQPVDRAGGHRLARAGLADQPDRLARPDLQRHVPQHRALGALDRQRDGQVPHRQERVALRACRASRAHRRTAWACSNSRSPRMLNAMTTPTMQTPAASAGSG